MKAQLILENGVRFKGTAFGAIKDVVGEVVFTSGMTGYQEMLTDPSCAGQIVTMTFPLVGNYGINLEDMESDKASLAALVVREKCDYPSNFRNEMSLEDFLKQQGVVGIEGIDTRALTRVLRNYGSMKGVIAIGDISDEEAAQRMKGLDNSDIVMRTTTPKEYVVNRMGQKNVALLDFGVKEGVLRELKKRNCKITVFPANATAEEILASQPDMLFLSNGAGNPENVPNAVTTVKELIGKIPVCGECLGHLILALALGGRTEKMKFGHHGGHPVKECESGRVYVTTQNHNYVVSQLPENVHQTFVNVNDGTCEGFRHDSLPIMSVQFHPEASPGPIESAFVFDSFMDLLK